LRRQPETGFKLNFMIRITEALAIDESDLAWTFVRASGPGGQNVNKVSSAVELRFAPNQLPHDVKARLKTLAGRQMSREGELIITSQRHRSQLDNRSDALDKLVSLLRRASIRPKRRIATRPTKASKTRRLETKTKRSTVKKLRRVKAAADD
jgi:ribosome-associated protein